jgi:hypothetical protein
MRFLYDRRRFARRGTVEIQLNGGQTIKKRVSGRVDALDVLFVGNSFTARNDVPGLIARLAAARGKTLANRLISTGGASLRTHWNRGEAQEAIAASRFDYVVLQEQTTLPTKNVTRMHENIRRFNDVINASGARTALYMTWAREHEPQNQQVIADAYTSIGSEIGATVVPVGIAWQRFLSDRSSPALYDRDGSHPTRAGSYLAACVFFSVLFGESPLGIDAPVEGLSADDTALLRATV